MSDAVRQHDRRDPECLRVFELLSEYLDGELSPAACVEIENHMTDCPACIDFLESLKRSITASRHLPPPSPPPSMPEPLREKLIAVWQSAVLRKDPTSESVE